ncbi:MAG: LURP-one-related family protein [Clostridiales bacterium]|nr:LURP-one-related family protein [Clostridiales bacterium]
MSTLLIKQRVFSWTDSYNVYDEGAEPKYFVKADLFSIGKRIRIMDRSSGEEVGMIHQRILTMFKTYEIYLYGQYQGVIKRRLSFFTPNYDIDYRNWTLRGDYFHWDFDIFEGSLRIANISKKLLSFGDTYVLQTARDEDELPALLMAIAMDAAHWSDDN